MKFDVESLFPSAVKVDPISLREGDNVLSHLTKDRIDEYLVFFEVSDVDDDYHTVFSTNGDEYYFTDHTFYQLPRGLPTKVGSIIRDVFTNLGVDPYASGTLRADGLWHLVSTDGISGAVAPSYIKTFEVV